MSLILILTVSLAILTQPGDVERELVTQLPVESIDYVIVSRLEASRADELLHSLFDQLKIWPRYKLTAFVLPGEKKSRLVFIRGKDAEVRMVKKILGAMEEAATTTPGELEKPFIMSIPLKEVCATEMKPLLIKAASRAGLVLSEKDLFIYPEGPNGSLFFIGAPALADRVTEISEELDRVKTLGRVKSFRVYLSTLMDETGRAFGALFATLISALVIIVLHIILCHIPFIGPRYRSYFRLFWEKLFASFKGRDLALEIIQTAAELGVAAGEQAVLGQRKVRELAPGDATGELLQRMKERATVVASDYIRWRGVDLRKPEVGRLMEAAVDAEMVRRK